MKCVSKVEWRVTERCTLDVAAEKSWDVLKLFLCCGGVKPGWPSLRNVL